MIRDMPYLCLSCNLRHRQGSDGLCRRCAKEQGDTRTTQDRAAERAARRAPPPVVAPPVALASSRGREVRSGGRRFEVVWDGT